MNRRQFVGHLSKSAAVLALASTTIPLTGCNAVTDLENWIPVALTSVSAIVKLLGNVIPAPVATTIALIQAGFSALLTAIKNYQAGSGVLADITNAITAVESAFASFFTTLNVPTGLLNTIEGLAQIILSTIQAFANQINPASITRAALTVGGQQVPVSPVKRSVKKYRSDWNAACVQYGHPEAEI